MPVRTLAPALQCSLVRIAVRGANRRVDLRPLTFRRGQDRAARVTSSRIQNERPCVRRHEVAVLELQVVDRHHRQAAGHARPARPVVEAEMDAGLGADVEQAPGDRIGAHDARDLVGRQVAVDRFPAPPAVGAPEQVGLVVGELVARGGDIDRIGVVRRDLDATDIGEFRHALGRDVLPALAVVARDMDQAVVGRGPDLAAAMRRFDDAGQVAWTSAPALSRVIGPPEWPCRARSFRLRSGEMRCQLMPSSRRAEHAVAADIERRRDRAARTRSERSRRSGISGPWARYPSIPRARH